VALQNAQHHISQVADHMEPIGDLDCPRRSSSRALGILPSPISTDNLTPWMLDQPVLHRLGRAVREELHHLVPLEIDHDRPIGSTLAEGEVVDGKDSRCLARWDPESADLAHEGIPADRCSAMAQQASTRFSTEGKGHVREPGGQPVGTTRMGAHHTRDAFGRDAPRAGVVVTEEPASLQTG